MTRAQDLLVLSASRKRKLYSLIQKQEPSRFLSEIPEEYYYYIEKKPAREIISSPVKMPMNVFSSGLFETGSRVKHPKWGLGVVRDCYGECDDMKVMVNFPSVGIKRL